MRLILITLLFIEAAMAFQKDETERGHIPPVDLEFPSEGSRLTEKNDSSSGGSDGGGSSCGGCGG